MKDDKRFKKVGQNNLYRYRNQIYYCIVKRQGKVVYKSLKTVDRTLAERKMRDFLGSMERKTGEIALKPLCDLFMETRRGRQPKTIEGYSRAITRLLDTLGPHCLAHEVKPLDISKLFAKSSQDYSGSTHNHLTETVNLIFEMALHNGYIFENPVGKVEKRLCRKKVIRKPPMIPTQEQFEQIVNDFRNARYSDTRRESSDLVEFLGLAALGQAEAESLKWQDVDWENEKIHVQRKKTGQYFYVPFYPWLKPFLVDLWNREGQPILGQIFKVKCGKMSLRNACKALKLPHFSPRNLRQYGIVRLLRAGLPVKLVSKYQGHQDGGRLILSTYSEVVSSNDSEYEKNLVDNLKI
jgi:integrase